LETVKLANKLSKTAKKPKSKMSTQFASILKLDIENKLKQKRKEKESERKSRK
jgi:hypothetical protein